MTSSWEKYEELSKAEMKKVYSETTIDHVMNPRNIGNLKGVDDFAKVTGPCGDAMAIWLKVEDGKICEASFTTDGCMTSLAAGSMATELAKGKSTDEAQQISQQDVLDALGGLPKDSEHCALLAANTLKEAIKNYTTSKKQA